jgi:hypothetical protein
MSNFIKQTKNPMTGRWENAEWLDDHFGPHRYGVRFPSSGEIFPAELYKLKTRDAVENEKLTLADIRPGSTKRKAEFNAELCEKDLHNWEIKETVRTDILYTNGIGHSINGDRVTVYECKHCPAFKGDPR